VKDAHALDDQPAEAELGPVSMKVDAGEADIEAEAAAIEP
jgi:hypothetical protein